jgi:hypothetical protein
MHGEQAGEERDPSASFGFMPQRLHDHTPAPDVVRLSPQDDHALPALAGCRSPQFGAVRHQSLRGVAPQGDE